MRKFKVGDKVRIIQASDFDVKEHGLSNGMVGRIIYVTIHDSSYPYYLDIKPNRCMGESQLELINDNETIMSSIKEKFVLAITPEPQKSFRKAGITNGDDLLTDDGQKIFLSWLLTKHAEEFKKNVVDGLLEDDK